MEIETRFERSGHAGIHVRANYKLLLKALAYFLRAPLSGTFAASFRLNKKKNLLTVVSKFPSFYKFPGITYPKLKMGT